MKYPAPSKAGMLKRIHIEAKVLLAEKLKEAGEDLDVWCDLLGLELVRCHRRFRKSSIVNDMVFVDPNLSKEEAIYAIAHEWFHFNFHPAVAAYSSLDVITINRNENYANLFAEGVASGR